MISNYILQFVRIDDSILNNSSKYLFRTDIFYNYFGEPTDNPLIEFDPIRLNSLNNF